MGRYIAVEPNVKVFVEDIGAGPPVLMLHGWPLNHRMYEYQSSQLPTHGFRCILPDMRGFGLSDHPWHGYHYDRLADDVLTIIRTLGLQRVRLVGFSIGGAIAIRYMNHHQGYGISQLILLDAAAPSLTRRPDFPYGLLPSDVTKLIEQTYQDRPQMLYDFGQRFFASQISPSFREWTQSLGLQASLHGTTAAARTFRDEDLRPDLPHIQKPTWILHGVLDQVALFPLALQLQQGIRGSQLVRFEQSGHAVFYDELELFNRTLLQILQDPDAS
ncbi:alpha/beta hydrolase [Paenibacillus sp. P96]|uniref:Alpha/beta hydrolase n=1 Tax=Paenibacillus zeirhizosphaerae TaxID=2987519 RepID=A0ABT9FX82_9BACL|nr:alpha/beta hydrolase [Paenibacillus sp. P96]MDP4099300.1 alpha/beta hydrolase [Paenibacillus sp. P96]